MLLSVNGYTFQKEVLNSGCLVFVNFWISRSEQCNRMRWTMKELDADMENGCRIVEVDWEGERELAEKYSVVGVPTLLIFKEGELIGRYSGILNGDEVLQVLGN